MHDLRLAVRALRATPIVSIVAVLSLALGIGANTAIFSLVNSLLLRTLPVVEPQRLALLSSDRAIGQGYTAVWTYGIWNQIRQRTQPFDGAVTWSTERFNLAQSGGGHSRWMASTPAATSSPPSACRRFWAERSRRRTLCAGVVRRAQWP
jgi:hypothetical protein